MNVYTLFDLERVEVLRGLQATLFGRKTTGGLANYIYWEPNVLNGYNDRVTGSYGSSRQFSNRF